MSVLHRRQFLSSLVAFPSIVTTIKHQPAGVVAKTRKNRLKTSLNAFSFNNALLEGTMSLFELLEFCAGNDFDGVDITGYYFKGYPKVPADDYLFDVKRKAFDLGLEISGTGVRNDFTIADKNKRKDEVQMVKNWIEVAAKIGAPVIRVFAGNMKNDGIPIEQVTGWVIDEIRKCVEYGKEHGVIIGLQNHNDFIQTADQVINIIETVNSEWLGLILDTGSYRIHDPYAEIEKSIRYTVNWQIKENVFVNGKEVETDMDKLMTIIDDSDYNGYLPIETLGEGDPKAKITALMAKLKRALLRQEQ